MFGWIFLISILSFILFFTFSDINITSSPHYLNKSRPGRPWKRFIFDN